ncbi:hypothetical protein [Pseudomonas frederiksbergensis]|uniref:hypothetical protein n=1 Tax=Pseudomonas frederiksbergensis TaxID=104087 RepID=UPI003D1E0AB5
MTKSTYPSRRRALLPFFCPKDPDGAIGGRTQACQGLSGMSGNFTVCKTLQKKEEAYRTLKGTGGGRILEIPVSKVSDLKKSAIWRLFES